MSVQNDANNVQMSANSIEKLCTIMHSITQLTPKYAPSRPTAPWRVVLPPRITMTGKQSSRYFKTKLDAEKYIRELIANLKKYGSVHGRQVSIDSYSWNLLAAAASEINCTPLECVTHYINLVKKAGNVLNLTTAFNLGLGMLATADPTTLADAVSHSEREKTHQSSISIASRARHMRRLAKDAPDLWAKPLSHIHTQEIRNALDRIHPDSPTSWNNLLRELNAIFNYSIRQTWITKNPAAPISYKHRQEKEITAITPAALRQLFLACTPPQTPTPGSSPFARRLAKLDTRPLRLYIALAAFAGIRPQEITRLTWSDISLEENIISIRAKHSKTGGTRHISIHPTLLSWLHHCMPASCDPNAPVILPNDLKNRLLALRIRAGYNDSNPWQADILRHSFASYSLKNGHPLEQLQLDMGHTSLALLRTRYLNMRGLTRASAADYWTITPASLNLTNS